MTTPRRTFLYLKEVFGKFMQYILSEDEYQQLLAAPDAETKRLVYLLSLHHEFLKDVENLIDTISDRDEREKIKRSYQVTNAGCFAQYRRKYNGQ